MALVNFDVAFSRGGGYRLYKSRRQSSHIVCLVNIKKRSFLTPYIVVFFFDDMSAKLLGRRGEGGSGSQGNGTFCVGVGG